MKKGINEKQNRVLDLLDKNRIIDNTTLIRDLLILCDGDIRTNSNLEKYANRIWDITDNLIDLVKDMQKEKDVRSNLAYEELKEFCDKAYCEYEGTLNWKLDD